MCSTFKVNEKFRENAFETGDGSAMLDVFGIKDEVKTKVSEMRMLKD